MTENEARLHFAEERRKSMAAELSPAPRKLSGVLSARIDPDDLELALVGYELERPDKARISATLRKLPLNMAAWLILMRAYCLTNGLPSDREEPYEARGVVRYEPFRRPANPSEKARRCPQCDGWGLEFYRDNDSGKSWVEPCATCGSGKTESAWRAHVHARTKRYRRSYDSEESEEKPWKE